MDIALVSLDQRWEDKEANLESCREIARRASERGAGLVVFPEMTLTGFTMAATAVAEPAEDSATIRSFAALARELRVNIAFGVVLKGRDRPTNSLVVMDSAGREVARYAKVHPFSLAREGEHYEAGERTASARIEGVPFGLTICYDLRFPELYSALAPACRVILVIANWPAPRIAHWHTLLRARAIESQCFVVGVNRTGEDPKGHEYPRSSEILDPAGDPVEPHVVEGELEICAVDPALVDEYRRRLPFLPDRRPATYLPPMAP